MMIVHYAFADSKTFVLSVRDFNQTSNEVTIRHYRIRVDEGSGSLYITQKRSFNDLMQLIEHYKRKCCCSLSTEHNLC